MTSTRIHEKPDPIPISWTSHQAPNWRRVHSKWESAHRSHYNWQSKCDQSFRPGRSFLSRNRNSGSRYCWRKNDALNFEIIHCRSQVIAQNNRWHFSRSALQVTALAKRQESNNHPNAILCQTVRASVRLVLCSVSLILLTLTRGARQRPMHDAPHGKLSQGTHPRELRRNGDEARHKLSRK